MPTTEHERLVAAEGSLNLRDLGGYPAADGRQTAWGRLYRSDALSRLSPAGVETLTGLALRLVCDLRTPEERAAAPSPTLTGASAVSLPISAAVFDGAQIEQDFLSGRADAYDADFMRGQYREMVRASGTVFANALGHLADPDALPAVVHCTQGKDRTGVFVALTLLLLGVSRDHVLDDYVQTEEHTAVMREAVIADAVSNGLTAEQVTPLLAADPSYLHAALDEVDLLGGPERYLGEHGLHAERLTRVRDNLLE